MRLYPGRRDAAEGQGARATSTTCVVRENTGDIYTGTRRQSSMKGTPHEVAVQNMVYNRAQVERCLRYAFDYARKHGKKARGIGDDNTLGPGGQDQRAHLRLRPVGPRLPRDRREGLPGRQARVLPRGRHLHVDGQEPRVVRRAGHRQHVRRHHHRPGRRSPRAAWASRPAATSTPRASACSSPSAARRPSTPA